MGKNNKKNPFAGKRLPNQSNPAKASKLPGKKPKPTSSSTNNNRDGSSGSKRSKRSVLGYLVGVGVSVVVWGWSVYQHAVKLSRDKDTLTNMRRKPLYYTEHAACRMDCRFVSKEDVQETLRIGRINDVKSEPSLKPCPKYVVDADIRNGSKQVQAVFGACARETTVITVIDKGTDWPCGPC